MLNSRSKGYRGRTSDAMVVSREEKNEANVIGNECQVKVNYSQKPMSLLPRLANHRKGQGVKDECTRAQSSIGMVRMGRAAEVRGASNAGLRSQLQQPRHSDGFRSAHALHC